MENKNDRMIAIIETMYNHEVYNCDWNVANDNVNDIAILKRDGLKKAVELMKTELDGLLVKVVHCGNCKHHHVESYGEEWCGRFDGGMGLSGTDYCSYGVYGEAEQALKELDGEI